MPKSEPITMESFLFEETNFDELIVKMPFSEETVLSAAAEQPMLFTKAARARVQTMREHKKAKAMLKQVEAQTYLDLRQQREGTKVTEAQLSAMVTLDPHVIKAEQIVRNAEAKEELGFLMIEAYRHRRDMIEVQAPSYRIEGNDPFRSQMSFTPESVSDMVQKVRNKRRVVESEDE